MSFMVAATAKGPLPLLVVKNLKNSSTPVQAGALLFMLI